MADKLSLKLTCIQDPESHVLFFEHTVTFLKKETQKLQVQPINNISNEVRQFSTKTRT